MKLKHKDILIGEITDVTPWFRKSWMSGAFVPNDLTQACKDCFKAVPESYKYSVDPEFEREFIDHDLWSIEDNNIIRKIYMPIVDLRKGLVHWKYQISPFEIILE